MGDHFWGGPLFLNCPPLESIVAAKFGPGDQFWQIFAKICLEDYLWGRDRFWCDRSLNKLIAKAAAFSYIPLVARPGHFLFDMRHTMGPLNRKGAWSAHSCMVRQTRLQLATLAIS